MGYQPTNNRTLQGQGGPYPSDQGGGRRAIGAESRPAVRPAGAAWGPQGVKAPSEGPAATPAPTSTKAPSLGPQTQNAGTSAQAPGLGPQTMQAAPYGWNPPVRQLPPGLDESGRGFTGQQGGGRRPIGPSPTYGWGAQPVKPPVNTAMNGQGTMDGSFGGDTWFGDQTGWGFQGGQPPAGVITGNTDGRRAVGGKAPLPNYGNAGSDAGFVSSGGPSLATEPRLPNDFATNEEARSKYYADHQNWLNSLPPWLRDAMSNKNQLLEGGGVPSTPYGPGGGLNEGGRGFAGPSGLPPGAPGTAPAPYYDPSGYNNTTLTQGGGQPNGPLASYLAQLRNPSRSQPPSGVTTGGFGGVSI